MRTFARAGVALLLLVGCGAPPVTPATPTPGASATAPSSTSASTAPSTGAAATQPFTADLARIEETLSTLQAIADDHDGVRTAGTAGYEASVDAAATALGELGWDVDTPEIAFTAFRDLGARLEVGDATFIGPDEVRALIYSPGGEVSGTVAILAGSGCDPDDFAGMPSGALALTTTGGCLRRDQAVNAAAAGAGALIVGYPGRGPGEIFRPTLIDPGGIVIPVVSVTDAAVAALTAADGSTARLSVETEMPETTFRNVIAQLGDGPSVLVLGGHLDSVLDGPGINDNGSGVAALLEIARGFVEAGVPQGWTVRIGLWGAEEFGSIGSRAYVDALDGEVAAYLNLDMTGSVNGATLVYEEAGAAPGSEEITAAYEAWLNDAGEAFAPVDIGLSSDHFGFAQAGIPTGGLFAGASESGSAANPSAGGGEAADPCYHIACDTIGNVDLDRVALFTEATYAVANGLMAR
jgi:Zn-dependent M28 family amino/carboxypeptidase